MARHHERSPFLLIKRLAIYEFEDVDRLVNLAEQQRVSREKLLKRLTPSDEDRYFDDAAEIDAFARLYSGCAVVALWRCVELCRKRVIANAAGAAEGQKAYRDQDFCKTLKKQLGITESQLRCSKSVKELRCLNNAVKHGNHVDGELAALPGWKRRRGQLTGDLRSHYVRLRPMAERYIDDLTQRATKWLEALPHLETSEDET